MPLRTIRALAWSALLVAGAVGMAMPSTTHAAQTFAVYIKADGTDIQGFSTVQLADEIRKAVKQQGHVLTDADLNELAERAAAMLEQKGAGDIRVCTRSRETCLVIEQ